jgi:hypothetical protein
MRLDIPIMQRSDMMSESPYDLLDANERYSHTDWFRRCRETGTPYVMVRGSESAADVFWDFVTLPSDCDPLLRERHDALAAQAKTIFTRYAVEESCLRIKQTTIAFDRLPLEQAKLAASELCALITREIAEPAKDRTPADVPMATPPAYDKEPIQRRLWVEAITASDAA